MSPERELPPRTGTYRLGVYGSMMNPPHRGHIAVVDAVHEACRLDRVVVVPAGIPPHRRAPAVPARERLAMAVRAFADLPHVVVSDTEVERGERGEPGYMVDTVAQLVDEPAELGFDELTVEPWLVVGADQAATIGSWHDAGTLLRIANVAVVDRPDQLDDDALSRCLEPLRAAGARVRRVGMPPVPISSTGVRRAASAGDVEAVSAMVPPTVVGDVMRLYGA